MTVAIVIAITLFALVAGAVWGAWIGIPRKLEGFLVATAGGALIISLTEELIRPGAEKLPLAAAMAAVAAGAVLFTVADRKLAATPGTGSFGLLLAITLDGVPENLALGTALIGSTGLEVAALAGSIFLSNLPEAAGGAQEMKKNGYSTRGVIAIWTGTALLLAVCALAGYFALDHAPKPLLGTIECFAGGAVVASLATEVFPKAFREDRYWTGFAVTLGLILAYSLGQLGG